MDELKKILKASFYKGNEVADMPSDYWEGLADDWEDWYNEYVVNDFSKHLVMQRISKCAIMYDVNGLYKVIDNKGVTIHTDNLQCCVYYKEAKDKEDGYDA